MQGLLTNAGAASCNTSAATRFREALRLTPVGPNDQRARSQGEGGWNAPDELIGRGFNVFSLPSSLDRARAFESDKISAPHSKQFFEHRMGIQFEHFSDSRSDQIPIRLLSKKCERMKNLGKDGRDRETAPERTKATTPVTRSGAQPSQGAGVRHVGGHGSEGSG